jgi:hypothetical protein
MIMFKITRHGHEGAWAHASILAVPIALLSCPSKSLLASLSLTADARTHINTHASTQAQHAGSYTCQAGRVEQHVDVAVAVGLGLDGVGVCGGEGEVGVVV